MVSKQDIGYQVLYRELIEGRISRREFISKTLAIGLGAAGVSVLSCLCRVSIDSPGYVFAGMIFV